MSPAKIGKLNRLEVRKVWEGEARDFTPWLRDNIDVIGDAVRLEIINPLSEQSTGSFSVDIKAELSTGEIVVIENQYGNSDHKHLGQLITYLCSFEAAVGIWIVEKANYEHISAINWLNEFASGINFYLLKLEAIQIGDSLPAPLLTLVAGPSETARSVGKVKKEDEEKRNARYDFGTRLLDECKLKGLKRFGSSSPSKDAFISSASGVITGVGYYFWINQTTVRIELRIDLGKDSELINVLILHRLMEFQSEIELGFGGDLVFAEMEGSRLCSIRATYETGGYSSEPEQQTAAISEAVDAMIRLEKVTLPLLKKVNLESIKSKAAVQMKELDESANDE